MTPHTLPRPHSPVPVVSASGVGQPSRSPPARLPPPVLRGNRSRWCSSSSWLVSDDIRTIPHRPCLNVSGSPLSDNSLNSLLPQHLFHFPPLPQRRRRFRLDPLAKLLVDTINYLSALSDKSPARSEKMQPAPALGQRKTPDPAKTRFRRMLPLCLARFFSQQFPPTTRT